MLALNLSKIRTAHEQFEQVYQPGSLERTADFQVVAPVALAFDIHKDKQLFRLVGRVQSTLELPCSRCLEPFRLPVASPFDLRYLPVSEASSDAEREVDDEDLETSYYENDAIDLNELLREQFYLVLPMKPLCKEDCRGLCAQCGTNLNTGTCDCAPAWEDPRLAPLKELGRTRES